MAEAVPFSMAGALDQGIKTNDFTSGTKENPDTHGYHPRLLTLQRHLSTLTKFAPVESWCFDRHRQDKAELYAPVYLDATKPFRISVAVWLWIANFLGEDP